MANGNPPNYFADKLQNNKDVNMWRIEFYFQKKVFYTFSDRNLQEEVQQGYTLLKQQK